MIIFIIDEPEKYFAINRLIVCFIQFFNKILGWHIQFSDVEDNERQ